MLVAIITPIIRVILPLHGSLESVLCPPSPRPPPWCKPPMFPSDLPLWRLPAVLLPSAPGPSSSFSTWPPHREVSLTHESVSLFPCLFKTLWCFPGPYFGLSSPACLLSLLWSGSLCGSLSCSYLGLISVSCLGQASLLPGLCTCCSLGSILSSWSALLHPSHPA